MTNPQSQLAEPILFAESVANGGMVTVIDPSDLKNNQFQVVKNARVRFDKTSRRIGKTLFGPTKPDSNAVVSLLGYRKNLDTNYIIRFTTSGIYYTDLASWTALSGTLLTSPDDFFLMAQIFELLAFVDNGQNRIQKIDIDAGTFADLAANAPFARCITGFGNRLVYANIGNELEQASTIGWTGDQAYTIFDPEDDPSAGSSPLIEESGDFADPIRNLHGFAALMIVVRENSLWLAQKLEIESQPFNFFKSKPGYGTNAPRTCVPGENNLIFFDPRSSKLIEWTPGEQINEIGISVRNNLLNSVEDPTKFYGEYDKLNSEYHLMAKNLSDTYTKEWIINMETHAISYDEIPIVSTVKLLDVYSSVTRIDDLTGTIDNLAGTIDGLSATSVATPTLIHGYTDGTLMKDDSTQDDDNDVDFTFELRSKKYNFPKANTLFNEILFEYVATIAGSITLQYSKDNGTTWTTAKVFSTSIGSNGNLCKYKRSIQARSLIWRLTATDGLFDITRYQLYVTEAGELRNSP